jgi:ApaG protein
MYQATTRNLRVNVVPQFVEAQSQPSDGRYFWAYTIEIRNTGPETVQLISRYWHITDETGHVEEIRGPGVIGETPVLKPGETFRYTSGCPLTTPSGIMQGSYQMTTDKGEQFSIVVPAFSLDLPDARRRMN